MHQPNDPVPLASADEVFSMDRSVVYGRPALPGDGLINCRECAISSECREAPDYLIRDRDSSYGQAATKRLAAMGIRDHPTARRSPWQNGTRRD
jgi:hypothetical protein